MNLEFSGTEQISRSKSDVWSYITDAKNVAPCLPGLVDYEVDDNRHFHATVGFSVGLLRGKIRFTVAIVPDADGRHVNVQMLGHGLGSDVNVSADADIAGDSTATTLDWKANASMRGPVATVGARVIEPQAQRIIASTFSNVKARLSQGTNALMRRLAIFEDEPQAQQAATMLREQGFQAEVIASGNESYGEAIKRFFRGETHGFNGTTLVTSEDAEEEPFDNAVIKQYGRVITDTV